MVLRFASMSLSRSWGLRRSISAEKTSAAYWTLFEEIEFSRKHCWLACRISWHLELDLTLWRAEPLLGSRCSREMQWRPHGWPSDRNSMQKSEQVKYQHCETRNFSNEIEWLDKYQSSYKHGGHACNLANNPSRMLRGVLWPILWMYSVVKLILDYLCMV